MSVDLDDDGPLPLGVVRNAPPTIYLQYGEIDPGDEVDHDDCDDVTWCADEQNATDVKYIRKDLADATEEKLRAEVAELKKDAERLNALERAAIKKQVQFARSLYGKGFEIAHGTRVQVYIGSLRDAVDAFFGDAALKEGSK